MVDFVALLYADQRLGQLAASIPASGGKGSFQILLDAHQLDSAGKRDQATTKLRLLIEDQTAETRVRLWAGAQLRYWGFTPHAPDEKFALGTVLAFSGTRGRETIAVYRDKSMRYVVDDVPLALYEGGNASCDAAIHEVLTLADAMLDASEISSGSERPHIALLTLHGTKDATHRRGANALIGRFANLLTISSKLQKSLKGREFTTRRRGTFRT